MKRWGNCWIQLLAGIGFALLGAITIVTKHIGSPTIREQQANGPTAEVVGVLLIIMATMTLVDWIRKFRANRR
jgi:hypothetical protein